LNKILYLPTRFFPAISGAEFYIQRIAEIFTKSFNYEVDIYTSDAIDFKALKDPKGKIIKRSDKNYYSVNQLQVNRYSIDYSLSIEEQMQFIKKLSYYSKLTLSDASLRDLLKNGPYLRNLIDYFLEKPNLEYDIVHSTFFPYFNLLISLIVGKKINKPVVCTPFFHFSNPRYMNSAPVEVLKKFDLLIACTNLEKKFLIENIGIPEKKVKVISMGVDYEKFNSKKGKDIYCFKEKFFKKNEKRYKMVLFCGYKNYEKGALSILKAIPYIIEKYKKLYFVFIGPSTFAFNRELSKIQKIKNVRILNFSPDNLTGYFDKKKIAAFKEADIYLMPSRSDAFGIAFLEAWAAGKPVIGSDIGATPEVIRNNIDGLLVSFDNHKDIAEKVLTLIKNKKLRRKIGLAGNAKVVERYSWNQIAKKTDATYQDLL